MSDQLDAAHTANLPTVNAHSLAHAYVTASYAAKAQELTELAEVLLTKAVAILDNLNN